MKKRLFLLLMAALLPMGLMAQHKSSVHIDSTVNACTSYYWSVSGETYTESGVQTAVVGDTLFILDLSIHPVYNITIPETLQGGCTFSWGDSIYITEGTKTQTFKTVDNCDSTVTINLALSGQAVKGYTITACENYTWKNEAGNDSVFTESTVYYREEHDTTWNSTHDTVISVCDSLLTLNLTVIQPEQKSHDTVVSACEYLYFNFHPSQPAFMINRDTVINSDLTGFPLTDNRGRNTFHPRTVTKCFDSVVLAHITIKHKVYNNYNAKGCGSYTFETSDTSIVYTYTQRDSINWGKAANGCDSISLVNITINDSPVVYISGDLRINPNQTSTLYAHCDQNVTYTWDYNNSHDSVITTEPLTANTDIRLTAYNNTTECQSDANVTILVTTEGIDGVEGSLLKIYPNPTTDIVNISADKAISNVTVYNLNGQQVKNINNSNSVDMRNLSNGNYVLRIELEDGSVATSTIVKK